MQLAGLHWFRRKQRTLSRFVLAAFCLAWLQFAAAPCVMALEAGSGMAATSLAEAAPAPMSMPDGMRMAPGEHCPYCPPAQDDGQAVCAFPHDPQVDSRVGLAAVLLVPPPTLVLFVATDSVKSAADVVSARAPAPVAGTSLAVCLCRFLK